MSTAQPLPFVLYESALDRLQAAIHAGTEIALTSVGHAASVAEEVATQVPEGPSPADTFTASTALATALDEEARAALARHTETARSAVEGLAIHDDPGRVKPVEELGPKPFKV